MLEYVEIDKLWPLL